MKRQYIFDGYIRFTPSDNTLEYCQEDMNITGPLFLPVPASRLLQKLLEKNSQLIAKEELLVIVWEDYGMKGSMHNLAHYTMLIRKAFRQMNMEKNVVITVHKKGLMINPLIDIALINPSSTTKSENSIQANAESSPELTLCEYSNKKNNLEYTFVADGNVIDVGGGAMQTVPTLNKKINIKMLIFLFFLLGVFIIAISTGWWFENKNTSTLFDEKGIRILTHIQNCIFYTFNAPTNDTILINDILKKTTPFSLNCEKERLVIYATDAFVGPNISGKQFHTSLTICTESKNLNNMNSCVSHYYK